MGARRSRRTAILIIVAALAAGGCEPKPQVGPIRLGVATAPVNLDPRLSTDATSDRVNRLLYARLTDFDANYRVIPSLATWEVLTPTHYRFALGADRRRFHDGTRLTAADVVATYESLRDPTLAAPQRAVLAHVAAVRAVDADTIDFELTRADPLFPGLLVTGIVPVEYARQTALARAPIGSGPLRFKAWPQPELLQLERVADGQLVEVVTVPDPTVRALKLRRGELDLVQGDLPPELLGWLAREPGIVVERRPGSTFAYLGFRTDDPVVGRVELRRAIAHAIDRESIVRYLFGGAARVANAILPPEHWAGAGEGPRYDYDPARSRALIEAAGYTGAHRPRLTHTVSTNSFRVRVATAIQQQLAAVGFEVEIRTHDWGTFYGDIKEGRFQMFSLSWVALKMPDIFRYAFHSEAVPPNGANRGRYRDAVTDALIEAAEAEPELERRVPIYRVLQARLGEQLPYVPLWFEDFVLARRVGIANYALGMDGNYDDLARVTRAPP